MRKKYKVEHFKSREEWLSNRGLGGSSASAIVGFNPWMNALELYNAIVNPALLNHEEEPTDLMLYGIRSEDLIRKQFQLDFPNYIVKEPKSFQMFRRVDKPYLTATLDGILTEKDTKRKGILEIKTHDIKNKFDDEYWQGNLPKNYFIQIIHYLTVMNDFEFVELVAKLRFFEYEKEGGRKLKKQEWRYFHIERQDVLEWVKYLEKKETEFFENNVFKKIPPQISIIF